jgi:hypothetical protein
LFTFFKFLFDNTVNAFNTLFNTLILGSLNNDKVYMRNVRAHKIPQQLEKFEIGAVFLENILTTILQIGVHVVLFILLAALHINIKKWGINRRPKLARFIETRY